MARNWFATSVLIVVSAALLSVGIRSGDRFVLVVTSKSNIQRLSNESDSNASASWQIGGVLASNETRHEPAVLELSWKEKMLDFFSNKRCLPVSSDDQPTAPENAWLEKVTVLIGVMKGGTKAMNSFLSEHPQFVSQCDTMHHSSEMHFFNHINPTDLQMINATDVQLRYGRLIEEKCPLAMKSLLTDPNKTMFLDDTPLYMQDSDSIPQLLNCALPKAKIISVLRNPIDRAFSHYNFYPACATKTFDEWVDIEIQRLTDAGIVDAKDPYEELLAWQRYNKDSKNRNKRKCETLITRGLYAIQCLHYMTALEAAGRPQSEIRFVLSEDLQGAQRQHEYDRVLQLLGLENHTLRPRGKTHATVYTKTMNESTRVKLTDFYRPYNRRLYDLLQWPPVWE